MRIIPAEGGDEARAKTIDGWMQVLHDGDPVTPPNILAPSQLLGSTGIPDPVYYPNAGYLVRFLFGRYGVEDINRLFPVPAAALPGGARKDYRREPRRHASRLGGALARGAGVSKTRRQGSEGAKS